MYLHLTIIVTVLFCWHRVQECAIWPEICLSIGLTNSWRSEMKQRKKPAIQLLLNRFVSIAMSLLPYQFL